MSKQKQSNIEAEANSHRNLSGSIEQCKEELRDAYMSFKDLQTRCVIDLKHKAKDDSQVYYFQPETFLLEDPEKQRHFRADLLKKVGCIPKPDSITYLGDELHKSMCQTVADRSTPKVAKAQLCEFYKRRQYALQHMKYKLLCRWAHHNLTSETIENLGPEATFIFGKLEYNLEQAIQRTERLEQDDLFDQATSSQRPTTFCPEREGTCLYVENHDLLPQSLIREDDIEVYTRSVSHRNKLLKVVNKFMSRLKWVPMLQKYRIFENSIENYHSLQQQNIQKQLDYHDRVEQKANKNLLMTPEIKLELNQILNSYYCKRYENIFLNQNDKLLHSWRCNHDEVPSLVSDQFLLKIKIVELSKEFGLIGDIELDNGYSYSYQVTVFFPTYFQRQVLKSQFTIYDSQLAEDPNLIKKRTLHNMSRIDTNLFRDVSTTKQTVPSDEAIDAELKDFDIKLIRLKSAASWIDYVILTPSEPEWHKKQQALLNCDNPIDTLLQSGLNFIDVNDLASINLINEDNTQQHLRNVERMQRHNPHDSACKISMATLDGDKEIYIDKMSQNMSSSQAGNIQAHLLKAVQDPIEDDNVQTRPSTQKSIGAMQAHLLTSYYTLRFTKSKNAKTRILYTLNYFRSIQRRLAIDLREFATRDRMDSQFVTPVVQSKEASQLILNSTSYAVRSLEKIQKQNQSQNLITDKLTVFDDKRIEEMNNMASLRHYKQHGLFNNKIFSTCPSYPKFHAAHGEPIVNQPLNEEQDRSQSSSLTGSALKLMGRIEYVEINEQQREVYIKDDFGIYIMYDCVLQDMKLLEQELCKIGSLYLHRSELLLDPTETINGQRPFPSKDRLELIWHLLEKEADFQFNKVKLVQVYMECYEHVTDPLEQQQLMQVITDIMARRPRLNLNANYFVDAYDAEIVCLQKQFELIRTLVDMQVSLEKTENKRLQDSLSLSYNLANHYQANKWKYQDSEALLQFIKNKHEQRLKNEMNKGTPLSTRKDSPQNINEKTDSSVTQPRNNSQLVWGDDSSSSLNDEDFLQEEQNKFSQLLGLPQISLESIYQTYQEKDINILKLMEEHAHFITLYEGYPEFLTRLTHKSILDKNMIFKPSPWSQETGSLDFYESLGFATKFYALTQSMQEELYDGLKMWDTTLMTQIDIQVAEMSLAEFRKVIQFQDGSLEEYKGRQLLEDEQIIGSSDKMIFYAKEMIADLTYKKKQNLNPFLVAKLDLETIKFFDFPELPQSQNQYLQRKKGILFYDDLLLQEKQLIEGLAKSKIKAQLELDGYMDGQIEDTMNLRNISVPSQLKIYCNMMELQRLRCELILAATETQILQEVYLQQCEVVGVKNPKVIGQEGITFELNEEEDRINYVDHGPSHMEDIGLSIKEFDPTLLSNLNFRHPDTFKLNILTSGLEEIRAILQYQLLQKHLLIVATRQNQLLIDTHQRALSELNLIQFKKIAIPNSIIRYQKLLNRNSDIVNINAVKSERSTYKLSLSSNCMPVFYTIANKKSSQRAAISKEFSTQQSIVMKQLPHQQYQVLRIMRNYKLKLLTRFVQTILNEVYLDAQKIQAVLTCQRLRVYNRYFDFDPNNLGMPEAKQVVLKYETSPLVENFPCHYLPQEFIEDGLSQLELQQRKSEVFKVIQGYSILEYNGIPSTATLLSVESSPVDDQRIFKQKRAEVRAKVWGCAVKDDLKDYEYDRDPESQLKKLLPTFTPTENEHIESGSRKSVEESEQMHRKLIGQSASLLLDYEEALYFGDSKYAALTRYFVSLERIVSIEWFLNKLQFRPEEVIHIDNAIECGLPFWKEDDFDARVTAQNKPTQPTSKNHRSQEFFFNQIVSLRSKRNMAEVVQCFGLTLKSFIAQYKKTKDELKFDYLTQYTEFRYQQIVGSLHKLVQQFYNQKNVKAAVSIRQSISEITQMEHVKVVHLQPNNFSIQSAIVSPQNLQLEPANLIAGSIQYQDVLNFKRCVQPIINEKALEPPQVTLFQSLYQHDYLKRSYPKQFAGQLNNSKAFKDMQNIMLDLTHQERLYSYSFISQAKNQANDFMETVFNDTTMASLTKEEVYSIGQIVDAKKFINESTQALLLRNALICWFENSPLPVTLDKYELFERNFRQNYFWRQLEQKELLTKKLQEAGTFGQIPTQEQLKELKQKIDTLAGDNTLATQSECQKRDGIVKALREEFAALKKKVTLDNYFNMKAEIYVFTNEIEKFLIQASVKALDSECNALAKCFTIQVPKIQYHIHPFQQFAATYFDHCDPNLHLDVSNKITAIQVLLTKMRNRCTEVETLTSGPGMVFTVKDINDILFEFCRTIIKDQEKQFKSRSETSHLIEENYRGLLYAKDQRIKTLEHRIFNIGQNLQNIIDARLFQKGNQLIYELDSSNRVLGLFKHAIGGLEQKLEERIQGEQTHKFKRQSNLVEMKNQKFGHYVQSIKNMINQDWAEDANRIKQVIKQKADLAKITDRSGIVFKPIVVYPGGGDQTQINGLLQGAVVPKGFKHYSNCQCYVPDPSHPRPTLELAELEMLSEREARSELSKLCTLVRQQRILYRTKEMCMMTRYQDQINLLKKQLNSNSTLWDQLAESEKRERVLKQELLFTQQQLSTSEKALQSYKDELKMVDAERVRLLNFKSTQFERLKELETKVNKQDLFDNIDTDKLLLALTKKDHQLKEITKMQSNNQTLSQINESKRQFEVQKLQQALRFEQTKTQKILDKMDKMGLEIKMLESNDKSVATIWKNKCIELYDICNAMKSENEELRNKCTELINQGIDLAEKLGNQYLPNLSSESGLKQTKYTNSTGYKQGQTQLSSSLSKMKASDYTDQTGWAQNSLDKKVPMTQQRNRVQPLTDYPQVNKNDIKSIINGSVDKRKIETQDGKRFGSTNQSFSYQIQVQSKRYNDLEQKPQAKQKSKHVEINPNLMKPNTISFDLRGNSLINHQIMSPRTKQQSNKQKQTISSKQDSEYFESTQRVVTADITEILPIFQQQSNNNDLPNIAKFQDKQTNQQTPLDNLGSENEI